MSSGNYYHGDAYYSSQQQQQQQQHAGYPNYLNARTSPAVTAAQYQSPNQSRPATTRSEPYQNLHDRYQYSSTAGSANYPPVSRSTYDASVTDSSRRATQYNQAYPTVAQRPQYSQSHQQTDSQVHGRSQAQTQPARPAVSQNFYGQQTARPTSTVSAQPTLSRPETQSQTHGQSPSTYGQHTGTSQSSHRQAQNQHRHSPSNGNNYAHYSNVRSELQQQGQEPHSQSAESNTTVDPSQVYDASHEIRRQAQLAEAKKAKEDSRLAELAKQEEEKRRNEEAEIAQGAAEAWRLAVQAASPKDAENISNRVTVTKAKKAQTTPIGKEGIAKPLKKKKKSGASAENAHLDQSQMDQMQAAAITLMQTANGGSGTTAAGLEAQMKAMFIKMREFNALDPDMLSRLWQQERDEHLAKETEKTQTSPSQSTSTPARSTQPTQSALKQKIPTKTQNKASVNKPAPTTSGPATSTPARLDLPTTSAEGQSSNRPVKKTIWPVDKKASLAQAASTILMSMAGNNGRTLSPSEISVLLDDSPTYVELCDQIEAHGVKVDRSQFAKKLLNSVPDVKANGASTTPTNPSKQSVAPRSAQETSNRALANAEKRIMNGANLLRTSGKPGRPRKDQKENTPQESSAKSIETTTTTAPGAVMRNTRLDGLEAVKMFVDGQGLNQQMQSQQQTPTSAKSSKERKTNRAPAIRQSLPPTPATKQDLARKRTFADLVDLTMQDSSDDEDMFFPPNKRQVVDESAGQSLPTPPDTIAVGQSPGVSQNPAPSRPHPFTSVQNPATAMGTTTQATPNLQIAGIQVSTSTNPSFPPLPLDHPGRKTLMVKNLDKYNAIRRSSYDPKTIARDVLIASGRHPDMRSLNAHLEALKALGVNIENASDLSTFRWDVVDPGGPLPGSAAPPLPERPILIDIDADDEDSDNDSVLGSGARVRQTIGVGGGASEPSSWGVTEPAMSVPKKKSHARPRETNIRSHTDASGAGRGKPRKPEGSSTAQTQQSQTTSAYALLRQQQAAATGEPVKKRGRPVGWRKHMMADPSAYRGASVNKTKKNEPEPEPEPVYQVFKCEWKDCGAELHNLATLTKHVYKIHSKRGSPGDAYRCCWKDCGKVSSIRDSNTGRVQSRLKVLEFPAIKEWKSHVQSRHLQPIAWKQGDGPKDGVSDNYESEISESYMSDRQGRRVTPRVVAPDHPTSPARQRTQAEKDAEQTRAEAEARKRSIGPAVDRGGATLVTEKRRQGFRDDEDTVEVIDESDE